MTKLYTDFCVYNGQPVYFIGIDPGAKGGVVVLGRQGNHVTGRRFDGENPLVVLKRVALDLRVLEARTDHIGSPFERSVVALEKVGAMPGQGVVSMFTFGESYGRLQGFFEALDIAYNLVRPQAWQKSLAGAEGERPKDRVRAAATARWGVNVFLALRSRVPHQGLMDAALIADYIRRSYLALEGEGAAVAVIPPGLPTAEPAILEG